MNHTIWCPYALALLATTAAGGVTQSGSTLTIDMGKGAHNVTITATDAYVTLSGVAGVSPTDQFAAVDDIVYTSLNGHDTITVDYTVTDALGLTFDTGDGGASIQITGDCPSGFVDLDLDSVHGRGNETYDIAITSDANTLSFIWNIQAGTGSTDITTSVVADEVFTDLTVGVAGGLGTGSDTFVLDVVSAASNPALLLNLDTSNGADDIDVTWDQTWIASLSALITAELGSGQDLFDLDYNGAASASEITILGLVKGNTGSDTLTLDLDTDASIFATVSGTYGNDVLNVTVAGDLTGAPNLRGGKGWDTFNYDVQGTDSSTASANGGNGQDTCNGTLFSTDSCETINP